MADSSMNTFFQNMSLPRFHLAKTHGLVLASIMTLLATPQVAFAEPTWFPGITEPVKDVTMAFPVVGVVGVRPLEEGSSVKKGDVVIELDTRLEQLEVERRRLSEELALREFDRVKTLAQRNTISVSKEELDKKKSDYEIAKADREMAAAVVVRRKIISPISGYVAQFYKDVGEKCEDQQPVVRVVDTSRAHLVVNLDPKIGQGLRVGQKVQIEVETGNAPLQLDASILYISPVADAASGLLRVKAVFDNSDSKIRPGVAGRLRLP